VGVHELSQQLVLATDMMKWKRTHKALCENDTTEVISKNIKSFPRSISPVTANLSPAFTLPDVGMISNASPMRGSTLAGVIVKLNVTLPLFEIPEPINSNETIKSTDNIQNPFSPNSSSRNSV
jgi:hypothetical protein